MSQKIKGGISLTKLKKAVEDIRKKIFVYETLQAEKEIKEGNTKGPFKSAKDLLSRNV